MKTADLIPLILLELNEGDKYGFELTKDIETKSNGKIIIKQPTLYTQLKKLEKSKFISSYWQDSEIGGKRHYYKLTENGRLQVSTLPTYSFLLNNILSDEEIITPDMAENTTYTEQKEEKISIMDELLSNKPTPAENILPTEEVFSEDIDNSTELEINAANAEVLKTENLASEETFASNENVKKFTEKIIQSTTPNLSADNNNDNISKDILDENFTIPKNEIEIKYVDYQDLKNNEKYKYSKNLSKKLFLKALATSVTLFIIALLCSVVTRYTGRSGLYYFFFISSVLVGIFYPIIYLTRIDAVRLKYQTAKYENKTKLKLFIYISAVLVVIIASVIINISIGNNTLKLMLGFKNFENIYAPALLTCVCFVDLLFNKVFLSKLKI